MHASGRAEAAKRESVPRRWLRACLQRVASRSGLIRAAAASPVLAARGQTLHVAPLYRGSSACIFCRSRMGRIVPTRCWHRERLPPRADAFPSRAIR